MKRFACAVVLVWSVVALSAHAQNMKAGLWEITSKTPGGSTEIDKVMAQAQTQMAAMSPEQRKMVQDMMAKQGVNMGTGASGAMSIKMCMTREMVDNNDFSPQQGDCKSTHSPRAGNTMKLSFTCTNPPSSGEGQVTFVSPEAYNSKMTVNTTVNGKSEKMSMEGQGKWLSAECGAIKPPPQPKK